MTSPDIFQISILSEEKMYPTSTLMTMPQLQQGNHAPVHLSQCELGGGHTDFLMLFMRTGANQRTLCVPLFQGRGQSCGACSSTLPCCFKALGPFSGCCSDIFTQFPQSLLYCTAFISSLSWSGHCLGQPIKCSLSGHWWFHKLLSLPPAVDDYFFTLLLGTNCRQNCLILHVTFKLLKSLISRQLLFVSIHQQC